MRSTPLAERCFCPCHADDQELDARALVRQLEERGRYQEALALAARLDRERHGVDVRDPLEAVTACVDCLDAHAPALLERRPWAPPPKPPAPPPLFPDIEPTGTE